MKFVLKFGSKSIGNGEKRSDFGWYDRNQKLIYLYVFTTGHPEALTPRSNGSPIGGRMFNPFMPTVPTFAVRETDVSRHNGGTSGAPLKPIRDNSALRVLSSLEGFKGGSKCWNGGHEWVKGWNFYKKIVF